MLSVPRWQTRPYGTSTDSELRTAISGFLDDTEKDEERAADAVEAFWVLHDRMERGKAEGASRGTKWAGESGAVLDQAVEHLTTAMGEA